MRISEFSQAARAYQQRATVACMGPLIIAGIVLVAYAAVQYSFRTYLATRYDEVAVEVIAAIPMVCPVALGFFAMIPLMRRVERRYGVACPHCAKSLVVHPSVVIASRNCPFCGKRVLEEDD